MSSLDRAWREGRDCYRTRLTSILEIKVTLIRSERQAGHAQFVSRQGRTATLRIIFLYGATSENPRIRCSIVGDLFRDKANIKRRGV